MAQRIDPGFSYGQPYPGFYPPNFNAGQAYTGNQPSMPMFGPLPGVSATDGYASAYGIFPPSANSSALEMGSAPGAYPPHSGPMGQGAPMGKRPVWDISDIEQSTQVLMASLGQNQPGQTNPAMMPPGADLSGMQGANNPNTGLGFVNAKIAPIMDKAIQTVREAKKATEGKERAKKE